MPAFPGHGPARARFFLALAPSFSRMVRVVLGDEVFWRNLAHVIVMYLWADDQVHVEALKLENGGMLPSYLPSVPQGGSAGMPSSFGPFPCGSHCPSCLASSHSAHCSLRLRLPCGALPHPCLPGQGSSSPQALCQAPGAPALSPRGAPLAPGGLSRGLWWAPGVRGSSPSAWGSTSAQPSCRCRSVGGWGVPGGARVGGHPRGGEKGTSEWGKRE